MSNEKKVRNEKKNKRRNKKTKDKAKKEKGTKSFKIPLKLTIYKDPEFL